MSIKILKDSIAIGQTSQPQQGFKLPQIEIGKTEMKLTAGVASITIGMAGIEFEVGQNKQKIDIMELSQSSLIIKQQAELQEEIKALMAKYETQAQKLEKKGIMLHV